MIKKGKKIKIGNYLQDIIIILLLIGYIAIFYAYNHDIQQYQDVINNPSKLCFTYYNSLFNKQSYHEVRNLTLDINKIRLEIANETEG